MKRKLLTLKYDGITRTIKEWSIETGLPESIIRNRKYRGWKNKRILTEPARSQNGGMKQRFFPFEHDKSIVLDLWSD